jgi:hypothetical protein
MGWLPSPSPYGCVNCSDDLMARYAGLSAKSAFTTFEEVAGEAEPKWHERGKLLSFNAYHGARAVAEALDRGAQIVVTGTLLTSPYYLSSDFREGLLMSYGLADVRTLRGQRVSSRSACS